MRKIYGHEYTFYRDITRLDQPQDREWMIWQEDWFARGILGTWEAQRRAGTRELIEDVEVHAIYETGYWIPPRCDLLQRQLGLVQFDTAVNMGGGRAVRFLQTAVGCGVDGDFGPGTERAVAACDPGNVVATYCNLREQFYRQIVANKPSQQVFLKGWMNRLNSLRKEAGLPGYESVRGLDFGDAAFIARVPDIGEDPSYDF